MNTDLTTVDPQWAWSRFEPDARQPWNRALAAHLFRRASFAANSRQLDEAVKLPPADVVKQLVNTAEGAEFRQQIARPGFCLGVVELRRGGIGVLVSLLARQQPLQLAHRHLG